MVQPNITVDLHPHQLCVGWGLRGGFHRDCSKTAANIQPGVKGLLQVDSSLFDPHAHEVSLFP